ncbi:MAG: ATP-binding protein [Lachnospiraceae bacterium]|nr:ATP-binding protein [Lachnospiraceae bacterium]
MALSNEQFEKINRTLEERRRANSLITESRRREIIDKLPEYRSLENETAALSMECAEKLISEPDGEKRRSELEELRKRIDSINSAKKDLIRNAGYPADYLDPIHSCSKCLDTGFIDGKKCSCFKQLEIQVLYDHSNMSAFLKDNNFDRLSYEYHKGDDLTHFKNAVDTCKKFINNFDNDYHNLLFYGTVGTGKSFLSGCVAKELLDKGHSIVYFSAEQLFRSISALYYDHDHSTERGALFDTLHESDLLIIDDLGTEFSNEFTKSQLFSIFNQRITNRRPLVISTNLTLEDIRKNYSDRFLSRLVENSYICNLKGADIRIKKKIESDYN